MPTPKTNSDNTLLWLTLLFGILLGFQLGLRAGRVFGDNSRIVAGNIIVGVNSDIKMNA